MGIVSKVLELVLGNKFDRDMKEIRPIVERVKEVYVTYADLSNDQLREKTEQLKKKIASHIETENKEIAILKEEAEKEHDFFKKEVLYEEVDKFEKIIDNKLEDYLNEILPEAFSIVRETARRFKEGEEVEVTATDFDRELASEKDFVTIRGDKAIYANRWIAGGNEVVWDMVHYDVQLIGGVVLHQGKIAEMGTGEGKTLVATLPVFLNALSGRGVHLITVNDYLAKRDSEWMGPIYNFHGLSVDCIDKHQPNSEGRRKAYLSDITFGTNNEFGFDYLRDNMAINPADLVQRRHHYAIVDEVDSVLIDDARTPLIISGPVARKSSDHEKFEEFRPKVEILVEAQKNLVTKVLAEAKKKIKEGDNEKGGLLLLRAFKGLPKNKAIIKYLSEHGNKVLLQKTENFYMQDNSKNMHLVTDDLFFIIDEKANSIELTDKGIDLLTSKTDDEDFFILPDIGSEVAELEKLSLPETEKIAKKDRLMQDYGVKSERVHTVQQLLKAYALFEKEIEYVVVDNKVKIVDEQTGRIMEGRRYSDGLHQAIEAKERVKVEASTQTMATITLQNYFRMYHKLSGMTGTAETEAGEFWNIYELDVVVIPTNKPIVRDDKEDLVFKTKREKYNAVIDIIVELVEENRPVLVGTTSVDISELLSRMLKIRNIKHNVLNAKLHQREAEVVLEAGKPGNVTIATNMAGRGTDIKLPEEVKEAGGLAIIGTERHESRRVDRQLRGRAGRQGDPGSSQFFVSLEDDLMRLFGSARIAGMMDRLGLKEGEVIQHGMISRSIERAQKKVEENNFGIRKHLLEYDDVMNNQREVIYKKRRHALFGERLELDISNMFYEEVEDLVSEYQQLSDFEGFKMELMRLFSVNTAVDETSFLKSEQAEITETIFREVQDSYRRKLESIAQQALPVIKDVYEKQSGTYENIVVPVTDGRRTFNIIANLEKSTQTEGQELVKSYQKTVVLVSIDEEWKEHLRELDELRQSVRHASYEQKDPLLIYKLESFQLFKAMIGRINREVASVFAKGHIPITDSRGVKEATPPQRLDLSKFEESKKGLPGSDPEQQQKKKPKVEPVRVEKKVGRNEPCPCGSGKKYKQCHGKGVA